MVLLSNGCLCCTIRGDLVTTLASLLRERANSEIPDFDRVVIETTGLADPIPILLSVTSDEDLAPHFALDGVISVIDAVQGLDQMDDHAQARKQVLVADRLLVTKTDIATLDAAYRLRDRIARMNPAARIHDVVNGEISLSSLFDIHPGMQKYDSNRIGAWLSFSDGGSQCPTETDCKHSHHDQHDGDHHTHHIADIRSFSLYHEGEVTPDGLQVWMDTVGVMRGPDLLRVKGLVNVGGRPVVIQAVQHLFHPLVELAEWPDDERRSRFVFITRGIGREEIEKTLSALDLHQSAPKPGLYDAANYQRFVQAMIAVR
jgi:G3E family GTPase